MSLLYFPPGSFPAGMFPPAYFPGGAGATPPPLPASAQGAILARFAATPALLAALPGGLASRLPNTPRGQAPSYPYAVITEVGSREVGAATGDGGASVWEHRYHVAVAGPDEEAVREAFEALAAAFNYKAVSADPMAYRYGKVISATPTNQHMDPGVQPDRGNALVYRLVFTLAAISTRAY